MQNSDKNRGFIEVCLSLLAEAEGGRGTPIVTGYMPNWWLPNASGRILASAAIELLDARTLLPGGTATVRVHPFFPAVWDGVEVGAGIEVTEGPNLVIGHATVTRVVPAAVPAGRPSS